MISMDIEKGLPWVASLAAIELDNRRIASEAGAEADDKTLEKARSREAVTELCDSLRQQIEDVIVPISLLLPVLESHPPLIKGELKEVRQFMHMARSLIARLTATAKDDLPTKELIFMREVCLSISKQASLVREQYEGRRYLMSA